MNFTEVKKDIEQFKLLAEKANEEEYRASKLKYGYQNSVNKLQREMSLYKNCLQDRVSRAENSEAFRASESECLQVLEKQRSVPQDS